MNFWAAQQDAKRRTNWMVAAFIGLTFLVAFLAEIIVRALWIDYENPELPFIGISFVGLTFLVALFNYAMYQSQGGAAVAEALGAYKVSPQTIDPRERKLLNIVEEMAVATTLPMPEVFILQNEQINAFAAGTNAKNACICVTTGSMSRLSRDELQAVIGHEFGHIYNKDVVLGMKLSAMLMGFFFIFYMALRTLQFAPNSSSREKKGNPTALIALVMVGAGLLSYFAGKILSAMVSRQREYLADASSVQFTRNPDAMVGALKKIQKEVEFNNMPKAGMAFSHLYFDHRTLTGLFATHPPIEKRIEAIQGNTYNPN